MTESKLSQYKLHYEYHEDLPEVMTLIRRSKLRAKQILERRKSKGTGIKGSK